MNKKYLYKALCFMSIFTVQQAGAASLLPQAPDPQYDIIDHCPDCPGLTAFDLNIFENTTIVLDYNPLGEFHEDFDIILNNFTGADWGMFTIEYIPVIDPFADVHVGLDILATGTSAWAIDEVLTNDITGLISGMGVSFMPGESLFVHLTGFADRVIDPFGDYQLVITTSAVPVPAAVWLFGSGLIGLIGLARRKNLSCTEVNHTRLLRESFLFVLTV